MSLIVGLALGLAAVIALVKGHGALGIFAANHLTELVWGAAAVLLIVLSMLPRIGEKAKQRPDHFDRCALHPLPRAGLGPSNAKYTRPEVRAANPLPPRYRTARVERESTAANGAQTESTAANGARAKAATPQPTRVERTR
jgi:hypothetical protein